MNYSFVSIPDHDKHCFFSAKLNGLFERIGLFSNESELHFLSTHLNLDISILNHLELVGDEDFSYKEVSIDQLIFIFSSMINRYNDELRQRITSRFSESIFFMEYLISEEFIADITILNNFLLDLKLNGSKKVYVAYL